MRDLDHAQATVGPDEQLAVEEAVPVAHGAQRALRHAIDPRARLRIDAGRIAEAQEVRRAAGALGVDPLIDGPDDPRCESWLLHELDPQ